MENIDKIDHRVRIIFDLRVGSRSSALQCLYRCYLAGGVLCLRIPREDGQGAYLESMRLSPKSSPLPCNSKTDRTRIGVAVVRLIGTILAFKRQLMAEVEHSNPAIRAFDL